MVYSCLWLKARDPVLFAPALDAFFFQLSIGPDFNKEISSDSGACSSPASVIRLKDKLRKPLSLFRSFCGVVRIDPDRPVGAMELTLAWP